MTRNFVKLLFCGISLKNRLAERQLIRKSRKMKSMLMELRQTDYEQYEWLSKMCGLSFTTLDPLRNLRRQERWRRMEAARQAFEEVQNRKVKELREKIEKEREEFNRMKEEELASIYSEMKELGVPLGKSLKETLQSLGVETDLKKKRQREKYIKKMTPVLRQMEEVRKVPENADTDLP